MPENIVKRAKIRPEKLARAKELRREMAVGETILWKRLRNNGLDGLHFRRQQVIAGFIADFYCHRAGLVVEVDGGIHQTRREEDGIRDEVLSDMGIRVLRVNEDDVRSNVEEMLKAIAWACRK